MNFYNAIATGFFTSLFASGFFYLFLWILKPRISISKQIARLEGQQIDGEETTIYAIKVINRTWFYRVLDVRCELLLMEDVNTHNGTNVRSKPINLIRDQLWFIRRRYANSDNKQHAPYASIFGTREDLDAIWDDQRKRLQFRVICKHSMSGFSKVFDVTYYHRNACIRTGVFEFGDSMKIT